MEYKARAAWQLPEMPETWANRCKPPERSGSLSPRILALDLKGYRKRITSHFCLFLATAVLSLLLGCSSGNSSGGGTGGSNPVPGIVSLAPPTANAGGSSLTVTVNGENFDSTSTVSWNGSDLVTTAISDTQVSATIPAADIATAGSAQLTVVNPGPGGGPSNPVAFVIKGTGTAAIPGYLYVANNYDGTVSGFSIDPVAGGLTAVPGSPYQMPGYPFLGGTGTEAVSADPSGKFLYVANDVSVTSSTDDLPAYQIDSSTGALSPIVGSPFTTGSLVVPVAAAVDSTGKFLYVADQLGSGGGNNISEYSIDPNSGVPTAISQGACTTGLTTAVVTDSEAAFLFASTSSGDVCSFSISPQGILQPVGSPFSLGEFVVKSITVDPLGKFVYTANNSLSASTFNIAGFSTQGVGALNLVPGSPFATGGAPGDPPSSLAVDPLGRFLYVANFSDISGFSINTSTGAISMLSGFPFSAQVAASASIAADPSGQFLYIANTAGQPPSGSSYSVAAYAIEQTTGMLTPVPGSPFDTGAVPQGMAITRKAQ
jgi:6-phosphogluconolactonase